MHRIRNFSLASIKLQSPLHALFTLAIYPLIFVASIECLESTTLTGKNNFVLRFSFVVEVGRVNIYKWMQFPVTGSVQLI